MARLTLDQKRALEDWRRKCADLGITRDRPPCDFDTGEPLIDRAVDHVVVCAKGGKPHSIEIDWSEWEGRS